MELHPEGTAQAIEGVTNIAIVGISAGVFAIELMARKGLITPAEVDEFADYITRHMAPQGDELDLAHLAFQAALEDQLGPELVRIRRIAEANGSGA